MLSFIGVEGRTNPEVTHFIQEAGLQISPETARAGLMNYRKQFGLVENPKRGFYRLTEHGAEIIAALKNESLAADGSKASEPQPT